MKGNATKLVAEFVANTQYSSLPKEIVDETKRVILDAIGCMLGGYPTEIGRIVTSFVRKLGGNQQSTIVGIGERTSCTNAAYANGKMGNALDYDDTFLTGTHIGVPAVAAGLSLCEMQKRPGRDLITSIAVGYELGARIGAAFGQLFQVERGKITGTKKKRGVSNTMVFAAAGAAAKALGQETSTVTQTLAIAGGNCPVRTVARWAEMLDSPLFKYADVGWCSQTGVAAGLLANEGYTGYENIFDGDSGFWFMYGAEQFDYDLLTNGLGQKWYLKDNTYKLWPACRQPVYVLTALEEILTEHKLSGDEIEKVVTLINPLMMTPAFRNKEPKTMVSTGFSIPHLVAMMVLGIPRGPLWHAPETRNDPAVVAFRQRVEVNLDPRTERIHEFLESGQWRKLPTTVEVTTGKGEKFVAAVDYARGDGPWAPAKYRATNRDLEAKFRELASFPGSGLANEPSKTEQSIDLIWNLEDVEDVSRLAVALSPVSR